MLVGALLAVGFGSAAAARAAPLWQRLLERKGSARDHLRLAEQHVQAGRCGAAVFHFRMYLQSGKAAYLVAQVRERIATCLKRSGWGPPRPVVVAPPVWVLRSGWTGDARIPGGQLRVGSSAAERDVARALCRLRLGTTAAKRCAALRFAREVPPRTVRVARFRIQRTEVTWEGYLRCVGAGVCKALPAAFPVPRERSLPVVGVSWQEARTYCQWLGMRLPTEVEWVAAARGFQVPARAWPWGRHAAQGCARVKGPKAHGPAPVASQLCDASPFGVLGLAGNVREWVQPTGKPARSSGLRPVRGGSYLAAEWQARVAARDLVKADHRAADLGFRCAGPDSELRRKGR